MKMRTQRAFRTAGFTLVELMVSIVVATILITIAVPSYTNQIRQSRRTDARTAVLDFAQREERYMSTNSSYTADPTMLGYSGTLPVTLGDTYYQLSVCLSTTTVPATPAAPAVCSSAATATGNTFLITAKAINAQAKDTQCAFLYVDSQGNQTATSSNCWTN
jgi:type IV pilus assembly protein PilE